MQVEGQNRSPHLSHCNLNLYFLPFQLSKKITLPSHCSHLFKYLNLDIITSAYSRTKTRSSFCLYLFHFTELRSLFCYLLSSVKQSKYTNKWIRNVWTSEKRSFNYFSLKHHHCNTSASFQCFHWKMDKALTREERRILDLTDKGTGRAKWLSHSYQALLPQTGTETCEAACWSHLYLHPT